MPSSSTASNPPDKDKDKDIQKDRDSPSASSIFLPLGRKARRDSKSSLSHDLDQDALNHALNSIHTAASQSNNLTVFNDYTDPPTASSQTENKSLASEIQGGISGLYNKLKATVGVSKDADDPPQEASSALSVADDRASSKLSSGLTSKAPSPRLMASDATIPTDPPPSKVSSKATSISKPSIPSTPALRSPTGPPQPSSHLADPSVTSVNIHAVGSTNHSRAGSGFELESPHERSLTASVDSESLRKALSKQGTETSFSDRGNKLITSPLLSARGVSTSHDRGLSTNSNQSHFSHADGVASPPLLASPQGERSATRVVAVNRQENASHQRHTNPLDLLAENAINSTRASSASHSKPNEPSGLKSPLLSTLEQRPPEKLAPKINQSRLPGFYASRTTSSDSSVSAGLLRANLDQLDEDTRSIVINRTHQPRPLSKLRSKLLSKEFWMRDENAKDCFHCGEQFTTFRRKHHCRTCGQIFDNKCTVLISGSHFGSNSAVRVCKPCESIITSHDDDSSDYSAEDLTLTESNARPRTPEPSLFTRAIPRFEDDNTSITSQSLEQMARTPTMSFPVRRAFDGANRNSAVLEFDTTDRPLPRPSSSRSLKATHSIGHGHKRHHSRHQHIRNFKAYHEDRAPFQRRAAEEGLKAGKSSAFHRDSIIDPDLAQYLSDDPSSEEDQSINEALNQDKLSRSEPDSEKSAIGGLLAAVRKGRSRLGDRSIAGFLNLGREADEASVISSRNIEALRGSRKRNLSVSSSIHRGTPRTTRERLQIIIPGNQDDQQDGLADSASIYRGRSRMIRSASMHGMAAPAMELNRASIQHVHKMLQQLLRDADIPKVQSWEDALIPILLKATDDVDPDVQGGDDIDIRNYVKLKKIPGGKPGDTAYISGLIFTKNVALKSMARSHTNPKILIITFALEYARHEQHFMSLDPVIRQEKEYLANLVGRIAALKPDVLLAQRSISGLALELLEKAKITTIFNVKSSVLEAVSRCTQARVVHSMDKLTSLSDPFGRCDSFEVKTFVADGRRKTYVYLSGCPPQLGCTIALRGADRQTLSKIKRVTEFMVYVVYNLKLETCLMRDEFALIPSAPTTNASKTTTNVLPKTAATDNEGTSQDVNENTEKVETHFAEAGDVSNAEIIALEKEVRFAQAVRMDSTDSAHIPDDIPVPTFYEDLVLKHETRILSASPFVKFMQPYLLMRARELERRVAYLKRLRDQDLSAEQTMEDKGKTSKFTLIQPEMVHRPLAGASKKVREIIHAVHDAEYDKAVYNYESQKKQWETYLSGNRNLFDPFAHQNIVVLFSLVSTETSVPCSGPDLLAFSFYNEHETEAEFEADCTLGQYVEDLCYRANDICPSDACEKKMHEHHRQYVHGEAQITVFVQPYPSKMRGFQDVILMWSQCKICGVETTVTPMSTSTWKYSFGKYLELSFWSADLHARAGICPHDLHRDHFRYFGYKDFALRVHYDIIDLLEIIVPRMRLTWKIDNDLKFRNDFYTRLEHRITKFMVSVKLRLKNINAEAVLPETADACRAEIERLTKKANEEHASLIKQLQERYTNTRYWETIPLNAVLRATQEKVSEWDDSFADFERNYFPSETDIHRLATLQLKKIFLDRDVSVASLKSDDEGATTPPTEEVVDEKGETGETPTEARRPSKLSPEKTQSFLQSVLEEHATTPADETGISVSPEVRKTDINNLPSILDGPRNVEDVKHLDLAIASPAQHAILPMEDIFKQNSLTSTADHTCDNEQREDGISLATPDKTEVPPETPETIVPAQQTQPIELPQPGVRDASVSNVLRRRLDGKTSPGLARAHSQPAGSVALRSSAAQTTPSTLSAVNAMNGFPKQSPALSANNSDPDLIIPDKKLSERLGFSHLKNKTFSKGQSLIPRAVTNRKESRVSNLAKHFEQLSREFERERIRERRQRAARNMQSRVYPLAAPKPIVEVIKDVDVTMDERGDADDIFGKDDERPAEEMDKTSGTAEGMAKICSPGESRAELHDEEPATNAAENEADIQPSSQAPSEAEDGSDVDGAEDEIFLPDSPEDLMRMSQEDIDLKELPKHERTSLMKMLTNFWAERSSSGWTNLEYPLGASEHIFADCDIIVREDEPSSIIAFALDSQHYTTMLQNMQNQAPQEDIASDFSGHDHSDDLQSDVMHSLLRKTGTHLKYQFQEGPAKMLCKIFFAEQFDAVRRKCGVADRFVESLSRCLKWDSKGGKTRSLFLKTLDDRFILKSLSPIETQSFLKFAPNYFQIMSEAFFHELPSVIAKMFGFYQIIVKNPSTGLEYNWFLLVMENLFYDRVPTRIFDLKGSMRNRKMNATGEKGEVLLDENMVEFIYESPLFAREHSKKLLRSSVHNDTLFLARQNVMDYSLMVAIDENRKELVVGIIDCIRTYTWDKKLESWIKDRGLVPVRGGNKNRPTVTSPREYKRRFREAMNRYVLEAPDCWHQFKPVRVERRLLEGRAEKDVSGGDGGRDQDGDKENEVQLFS
ncbi:1-phosphatidylinositol-3-phosphate 5-kinase [Cladophialophora psammophila CBS 110553]|uniref:1-phosphatidylinositol-3-phosphate 5-kinase n=1 Tax=Cladophialophora psammophila CBS 110553 TaxID=1182543 RepID=W9XEB5_9EURO|nr:1-phosphatidylinositol-3-phosphate 5-kinase [Cladophialophora psammophila CBS 110553]EXJ75680.1 1-phosphatidylinositol-3-phosphate 5-kinase [Cladophialophora psammophila CBS 110553]